MPFAYTFCKMASEYSFITVSFRFYTQIIRSHRVASFRVLSKSAHFGQSGKRVANETMHDNNTPTRNKHVPYTTEFNQKINDFSIRRKISNMFKIQWQQSRLLVQKVYETKNEGQLWLTINCHLKRFLKNCYSPVIVRLISGYSLWCEAAFRSLGHYDWR